MIVPAWRWGRPTISSSSVVLPTPLRPMITTVSPGRMAKDRCSTTVVPSQPPHRPASSSAAGFGELGIAGLSEIDGAHLLGGHDLVGPALHQDRAGDHHRDVLREAAYNLHV